MTNKVEQESYVTYNSSTSNDALNKLTQKVVLAKESKSKYQHGKNKGTDLKSPNGKALSKISKGIAGEVADIDAILETLPEVERAMSILESAILSPNDLLDPTLMYRLPEHITSEASGTFITIVTDYLKTKYNLDHELKSILRNALHRKGSHVIAVLPESTVDDVINNESGFSLENHASDRVSQKGNILPLGILGGGTKEHPTKFAVESAASQVDSGYLDITDTLAVHDNYDILKLDALKRKSVRKGVLDALYPKATRFATESASDTEAQKSAKSAYADRKYHKAAFGELKGLSTLQTTTGGPTVMNLPSESVIPVHVPGNVSDHVGYFVLLDDNGQPVKMDPKDTQFDLLNKVESKDTQVSSLIANTRTSLGLAVDTGKSVNDDTYGTYVNLIERDLATRLKNGAYATDLTIATDETVAGIMMARALAQKKTKILFLPAELVTYIAFDYDKRGIGRTRLSGSKILASMRGLLLFTKITAAVKNSIPTSKLIIELDPEDDAPAETINDIIEEHLSLLTGGQSVGSMLSAKEFSSYVQRASLTVEATGNDKYPGTKVSVEDTQRSVPEPDEDIDLQLAKRMYMTMGLSPDIVDATADVEFATTIVANNLILAKLASELQKVLLSKMTKNTKQLIVSDGDLMLAIYEGVDKALKEVKHKKGEDVLTTEQTVEMLVANIEAKLPSAETAKFTSQIEAFEQYKAALDSALEAYVSSDMISDYMDNDLSDGIEPAIAAIRAYYLRQWLQRENVLPELAQLENVGEGGLDISEMHSGLVEKMIEQFGELFRKLRGIDRQVQRDLDKDTEKDEDRWDEQDNPVEPDPEPEPEDTDLGDDDTVSDDSSLEPDGDEITVPTDEVPLEEESSSDEVSDDTPVPGDDAINGAPDLGGLEFNELP